MRSIAAAERLPDLQYTTYSPSAGSSETSESNSGDCTSMFTAPSRCPSAYSAGVRTSMITVSDATSIASWVGAQAATPTTTAKATARGASRRERSFMFGESLRVVRATHPR